MQGVTHIIRGADLAASTHVHVLLQALLEWPTPLYHHHALLMDENGKRFAKRDKSVTLRALRAGGVQPDDILRQVSLL
jgi:glutamyl-Q tRNA(Asp) synthetase